MKLVCFAADFGGHRPGVFISSVARHNRLKMCANPCQTICLLLALWGFDLLFPISVRHYATCIALIDSTVNESMQNECSIHSVAHLRWRMREIIFQWQDIDSFTVRINDANKSWFSCCRHRPSFSISLSLFCVITSEWHICQLRVHHICIHQLVFASCPWPARTQNGVSVSLSPWNRVKRFVLFAE